MRTSFRHQSEAQPPNGPLTAATSPDELRREPRLELRAGKRLIHELIEDGDDLRRRVRRRADPLPTARLVARHKFANRWDVRQYLDAFGCRHCQGSQLTCLDIADR